MIQDKSIIVVDNKIFNIAGWKDRNWVCDSVDIEVTEETWSLGVCYPSSWELVEETPGGKSNAN